jgi:signal transduction histidine kinase
MLKRAATSQLPMSDRLPRDAGVRPAADLLEVLVELGRRVALALTPTDLARQAVALLYERFGYAYISLFLVSGAGRQLELLGALWYASPPPADRDQPLPIQQAGIVGWVASHGEPAFVADVSADPRHQLHPSLPTGRSQAAIPLMVEGDVLGVLDIRCDEIGAFDMADQLLLQAVADRVAVALENARFRAQIAHLLDQTRQQLREITALYRIAQGLTGCLKLDELLDAVVRTIPRALNCRGCCIFLLDPIQQVLQIKAASGVRTEWREAARLALGEGIAGRVAASAQPIYVPDTLAEPGYIVFDPEVRSLLAVPLQVKGKVIGVLNVDDLVPDAFDPAQKRLLTIAASQVAIAIDDACTVNRERELEEMKEEFLSIVSHQLRTPIACIQGYVDLILDDQVPDEQTQREFLQIIDRQTEKITLLVNNVLNISRLDAASLDLRVDSVQLADVVATAVHKLQGLAHEKQITLDMHLPAGLPLVAGDPNWLEQVVANLVDNAIKYTPNQGQVTLSACQRGKEIAVEVKDTGMGIPPESLSHLFTRFYRVPDGKDSRPAGTGLGLYIARRIVEAHGGRIWADSTPGQGSTFTFALPCA